MLSNGLEVIKEALCFSLALAMGVWAYRYLNKFYRLLLLQVLVYAVIYVVMEISTIHYNHLIFNIATFLEISILLLAACFYFKSKVASSILLLFYGCSILIYSIQIYLKGIFSFANFGYVTGGICIVAVYAIILFRSFTRRKFANENNAIIFACLGLLVYFACCTPYLSMVLYLNTFNPALSLKLFDIVNLLSNARYLLLAYAFWYLRKTAASTFVASK